MGRSPCCEKIGLKKGPWTPEEDQKLVAFIDQHGHGSWRALPAKAGLERCGKSCRLRWTNYLRPDIKRGKFSLQEEQTIIQLHALLGNRWSAIATHLPKRTDNEIKNYWNTHLKKRLTKMGIDPVTHKPCSGTLCATAGLSHMAQWESARLEAEARLVRESKLLSSQATKNRTLTAPPPCLDVLRAWQTQLTTLSSPSSCTSKESSAFSTVMGFAGGSQLESPTSTLSFPLMLPQNDVSYCDDTGNAWFDAFPELLVSGISGANVGESYGSGTGHHGTGFVGEDTKSYWNNVLLNLVTINASSSTSPPPAFGAVL